MNAVLWHLVSFIAGLSAGALLADLARFGWSLPARRRRWRGWRWSHRERDRLARLRQPRAMSRRSPKPHHAEPL